MPRKIGLYVDCFLRVPQLALEARHFGSMTGTPVELSKDRLQNLLYGAFCHLVGYVFLEGFYNSARVKADVIWGICGDSMIQTCNKKI